MQPVSQNELNDLLDIIEEKISWAPLLLQRSIHLQKGIHFLIDPTTANAI